MPKKILFEREGLRGYFATFQTAGEGTETHVEGSAGAADSEGTIPYLLKIRSGCEGGGKGALVQEDLSATLSTLNDQYLFQPICASGFCPEQSAKTRGIGYEEEKSPTLRAGVVPGVVSKHYSLENHPADSRVDIDPTGKVQTLTSRMGTGGGNVPMVLEATPIHDKATRFQGGGPTRNGDGAGNGLGVGEIGDPMYTITTGDHHAVAYLASGKETIGTLMANAGTKLWLGNQEAFSGDYFIIEEHKTPDIRYIVRRLTPTECARLQGFADRWGEIEPKDDFTDDEYSFWLDVRNTHAAINGKPQKEYTKAQMLTWYNKLHTDSAEYKLWGNGIALPPALYCMQGMCDALCE